MVLNGDLDSVPFFGWFRDKSPDTTFHNTVFSHFPHDTYNTENEIPRDPMWSALDAIPICVESILKNAPKLIARTIVRVQSIQTIINWHIYRLSFDNQFSIINQILIWLILLVRLVYKCNEKFHILDPKTIEISPLDSLVQ